MRSLWAFLVADWHDTHIVRVLCAVVWGMVHFAAFFSTAFVSYVFDSTSVEDSLTMGIAGVVFSLFVYTLIWWDNDMTDILVERFDKRVERGREIIRSKSGAAQGAGHLSPAEGAP